MASAEQAGKRQFINFCFFKVDPAWRRLPEEERSRGKQEFIRVVEEYAGKVIVIPYTTVGIRGDCDFMLWRIGYELELFQEMMSKLLATALGKYLAVPYSYLSLTNRSIYVAHPVYKWLQRKALRSGPEKRKDILAYPYVKTRWRYF